MISDRYFGVKFIYSPLWSRLSSDLSMESRVSADLWLIRVYVPELYYLAVLKCKKKLWSCTSNNVNDLYTRLCKKINIDVSIPFLEEVDRILNNYLLRDGRPLILNELESILDSNLPISSFTSEHFARNIHYLSTLHKYLNLRMDTMASLRKHNIDPENLNFGGIKDFFK
jgi:hypothetical protein